MLAPVSLPPGPCPDQPDDWGQGVTQKGAAIGALSFITLGVVQLFLIGSPSLVWTPVALGLGLCFWLASRLPDA